MRARQLPAKHTSFIKAMPEDCVVYLQASVGILMAMIALEIEQGIA